MHNVGWWRYLRHDDSKPRPKFDADLLKRVFRYGRPYWRSIVLVLLTIIVISLVELVPPLLFRDLIDNVLPNRDLSRLNLLAIAMLGIPIFSGLASVVQRYFSARAGEGIIHDLRQEMYHHLQHMSLRFFTNTKSGEIVSRFNSDVVGAQNAITGTIPNIVTNLVTLVSTLAVMVSIEWRLAFLSIAVLPLFLLPARSVARILREIRRRAMEHNAEMSNIITETLTINGALLVKTFGREPQELERFGSSNRAVRDIGIRRARVGQMFFMGLSIAGTLGTALIYYAGGLMVLNDAITTGTIVAFAAYLTRLYGPITALSHVQVEFAQSIVSFERVFDYLDRPIEIKQIAQPKQFRDVKGRVRFDNVWFRYREFVDPTPSNGHDGQAREEIHTPASENGADGFVPPVVTREWALQNISFEIEPGQLVALVRPSGAGKTTITYLLPRLYDPTRGSIALDGIDLRDASLQSLASAIGMVTQESYLFHDTIRANLLYAQPDATTQQLDEATKAANIYDLIASLPDGYDTIVGERGYRLSGGEKQRLSIARVILKNPQILVLDEATSHLDSQNEALIQAALQPLFEGRTSLVIAHRLSTILRADRIMVLDQGRLVEQGTHAELLASNGLYAHLYETQFRMEDAASALTEGTRQ